MRSRRRGVLVLNKNEVCVGFCVGLVLQLPSQTKRYERLRVRSVVRSAMPVSFVNNTTSHKGKGQYLSSGISRPNLRVGQESSIEEIFKSKPAGFRRQPKARFFPTAWTIFEQDVPLLGILTLVESKRRAVVGDTRTRLVACTSACPPFLPLPPLPRPPPTNPPPPPSTVPSASAPSSSPPPRPSASAPPAATPSTPNATAGGRPSRPRPNPTAPVVGSAGPSVPAAASTSTRSPGTCFWVRR